MKAAVWNEKGTFDILEQDFQPVTQGWARIAVEACGICGSDLHFWVPGNAPAGAIPGHEVAGFVLETGDGVAIDGGTPVALEPMTMCGQCASCRRGQYSQCRSMQFLGFGLPGGMAEYCTVPAQLLYPLPHAFPSQVAALAEPLAVCVRAVRRAGVSALHRVVILGAGTIGLMSIPAARAAGAGEVYITARHEHQADLARHLGVTQVFPDVAKLLVELGGETADVVIETVGGHAQTLVDAASVARRGGAVAVLGVFDGPTPITGFLNELTFVGSHGYAHDGHKSDFGIAVELIRNLQDRLLPVVTHLFPLQEINKAFATAADKSTGSVKVQVRLGQS